MKRLTWILITLASIALGQIGSSGGIEYDYWYFDVNVLKSYIDSIYINKIGIADLRVGNATVDTILTVNDSLYALEATIDTVNYTLSVGDSSFVRSIWVDGIAYLDSIAGHSPVHFLDRVTVRDSISLEGYTTPVLTWDAGGSGGTVGPAAEIYTLMASTGHSFSEVKVNFSEITGSDQQVVAEYYGAVYVIPPTDEWVPVPPAIAVSDTLTIPAGWSGDTTFVFGRSITNSSASYIGIRSLSNYRLLATGGSVSGAVYYGDSRGYTYDTFTAMDLEVYGGSLVSGVVGWDPNSQEVSLPDASIENLKADSIYAGAISVDTLRGHSPIVVMDTLEVPALSLNGDVQSSWPSGDSSWVSANADTFVVDQLQFEATVTPDTLLNASTPGGFTSGGVSASTISTGRFDTVEWYFRENHTSDSRYVTHLYDDSGGVPGSIVASSDTVYVVNGEPASWYTFNFDGIQTVTTTAYIGMESVDTGNCTLYRYSLPGSTRYLYYSGSWHATADEVFASVVYLDSNQLVNIAWDPANELLGLPDLKADSIYARSISVDTLHGHSPITIMDDIIAGGSITLGGETQSSWPSGGGGGWVDSSVSITAADYNDVDGYWGIYGGPAGWDLQSDTLFNDAAFRGGHGQVLDAYNVGDSTVVFFADFYSLDSLYSVVWNGTEWGSVVTEGYGQVTSYNDALVCFGNSDTSYVYVLDNNVTGTGNPVIEMIKTEAGWYSDTSFTTYSNTTYPILSVCQDSSGQIYSWQPTSMSQYILFKREGLSSWLPVDTVITDSAMLFDDLVVTDNQKIVSFLGHCGDVYIYDIMADTSSVLDLGSFFTGSYDRNYQGCRIDTHENVVYIGGMQDLGTPESISVVAVDCSFMADSVLWSATREGSLFRNMVQYDPSRDVVYHSGWENYASTNEIVYAAYPDGVWETAANDRQACLLWWNDSFGDMVLFEEGSSGNDFVIATLMTTAHGQNTGSATGAVSIKSNLLNGAGDIIFDAARNIVFEADSGLVDLSSITSLVCPNGESALSDTIVTAGGDSIFVSGGIVWKWVVGP